MLYDFIFVLRIVPISRFPNPFPVTCGTGWEGKSGDEGTRFFPQGLQVGEPSSQASFRFGNPCPRTFSQKEIAYFGKKSSPNWTCLGTGVPKPEDLVGKNEFPHPHFCAPNPSHE
jgi:hypothetical protein